jgi:hypothetical protein
VEVMIIEPNFKKGPVAHGQRGSLVKLVFPFKIVIPRAHPILDLFLFHKEERQAWKEGIGGIH